MDEETGGAWLDREPRCLVHRRFSGRPPWRHGCGIDAQPVHEWAIAGGHGRSCDVCRDRRRDGRHAAGIVGRAVDREPVAMSLFSSPWSRYSGNDGAPTGRRQWPISSFITIQFQRFLSGCALPSG